ncbi:hypothetical protein ABTM48_21350, partial [Acinetobacter baumannii]
PARNKASSDAGRRTPRNFAAADDAEKAAADAIAHAAPATKADPDTPQNTPDPQWIPAASVAQYELASASLFGPEYN